jgi:hypothetical protein
LVAAMGSAMTEPCSGELFVISWLCFAAAICEAEVENAPVTWTVEVVNRAPTVCTALAADTFSARPHRGCGQCCLTLWMVAGANNEERFREPVKTGSVLITISYSQPVLSPGSVLPVRDGKE